MRAEEQKGYLKEGTTRDPGLTPRGAPTRDSTTHTVSNRVISCSVSSSPNNPALCRGQAFEKLEIPT